MTTRPRRHRWISASKRPTVQTPEPQPVALPNLAVLEALIQRRDVPDPLAMRDAIVGRLSKTTVPAETAIRASELLERIARALAPAVAFSDARRPWEQGPAHPHPAVGPEIVPEDPERPLAERVADARRALRPDASDPAVAERAAAVTRSMRGEGS